MKYLITGGAGFIGTNLTQRLLRESKDNYIRIIDDLSVGKRDQLGNVASFIEPDVFYVSDGEVHLHVDDIKDAELALEICQDIDVVIHLAANTGVPVSVEFPREDCMGNVIGTLNYLEAARHNNIKKFIFASTSSVPGEHKPPFHEKLFPRPISPYGASKGAAEAYCHVYNATYGVETVSLRFSNVYGPYSTNKKAQLIPKFIQLAVAGQDWEIYGDGTQTRDFCFVDDLMDAIVLSIKTPGIGGNVFQIATNQETSVQKITDTILNNLPKYGIDKPNVMYGSERPGDPARNFSDVSKAKKMLRWEYKTDIEDGIYKTMEWFLR